MNYYFTQIKKKYVYSFLFDNVFLSDFTNTLRDIFLMRSPLVNFMSDLKLNK